MSWVQYFPRQIWAWHTVLPGFGSEVCATPSSKLFCAFHCQISRMCCLHFPVKFSNFQPPALGESSSRNCFILKIAVCGFVRIFTETDSKRERATFTLRILLFRCWYQASNSGARWHCHSFNHIGSDPAYGSFDVVSCIRRQMTMPVQNVLFSDHSS